MDTTSAMTIAGAVVVLVQIAKAFGVDGKWGLLASMGLSAIAMAVWAYSHGDFTRQSSWDYFVAYGSILTSAAGVFGLINKAPETVTNIKGAGAALIQSFKGTGPGQ